MLFAGKTKHILEDGWPPGCKPAKLGMAEPDVRSERARVPPPCPLHPRCTVPGTEGTLGASWGAAPRARVRIQGKDLQKH